MTPLVWAGCRRGIIFGFDVTIHLKPGFGCGVYRSVATLGLSAWFLPPGQPPEDLLNVNPTGSFINASVP
jgi:hypothetical protein